MSTLILHIWQMATNLGILQGGVKFSIRFSHWIWMNWVNDPKYEWGGRIPPCPPRGAAPAYGAKLVENAKKKGVKFQFRGR